MKLLFFIYSLAGGGAERVTVTLANYWAAKGWNIAIVTLAPAEQDAYALDPSITRISLGMEGASKNIAGALLQNFDRVMALRRVLSDVRPDIAVAMMDTSCVTLALAVQGLKSIVPVGSLHIHPPSQATKAIWKRLQSISYGQFPAILTLTRDTADWLAANTSARRIEVIPNPIPWPLPESEPKIEPETVCKPGRKLLLAAGRLVPQKGFDLLIDAFASLSDRHPDWDLAIVGEGKDRQSLESEISAKALSGRVLLPGWAGNIPDWYRRAQLYVLSSRFEGFGNTLAEAMAFGLPAVSFDCDAGPKDIIRDGKDGFLAAKGEIPALAAALDRLMGDEELRERFGCAAKDIRDRFSLQRVAQKWESVLQELLAQRRRTATAG
jgi:glycosyltransferase involved in cell wall biosynthesis